MAEWCKAPGPSIVLRSSLLVLATALVGFTTMPAAPVQAQAAAPTKPATNQEINAFALVAAVNACERVIIDKVKVEKAIGPAALSVAVAIENFSGGKVEGVQEKLSSEQLTNGSIPKVILFMKNGCYSKMDSSAKSDLDKIIGQIEEVAKKQQSIK